jgi:archaellum biogenesis protein FlaJ (TadC family)
MCSAFVQKMILNILLLMLLPEEKMNHKKKKKIKLKIKYKDMNLIPKIKNTNLRLQI